MQLFNPKAGSAPRMFSILLFLSIWLLTACSKDNGDDSNENEFNPAISKTLLDERYGSASRQEADVYLPANRNSNTPVVVVIHGGSWAEGDKEDMQDVVQLLRAQWPESAVININYTLANGTPATLFPAQMNDIKALLRYINTNRSKWSIGTSTAMVGASAGGHLALLFSYGYDDGRQVKSVVSIVGPTDFTDPAYTSSPIFQLVASNLLGKTWVQDPELHRMASPVIRATASSPPTFMAYGVLDAVVPLSNAISLRNRLQTLNVPHSYIQYPNEGHEFTNTAIQDVAPRVVSFLKTYQ